MFCFNRVELAEMGLKSFIFAFPGVLCLGSIRLFSQEIHPQLIKRDSIDEVGSKNFIITTYNDILIKRVVELFMKELPENLRTTDLQNRYVTDLKEVRSMLLEASQALKCKEVDVGFSFSDSSELFPMEPYMAIGGRLLSCFSHPFMSVHLNAGLEMQNLQQKGFKPFSKSEKKFIVFHEVGHIACNHTLVQSIASFAYGLFNTILWKQYWSHDYSLTDTFGFALTAAFVYQLFFFTLVRYQEKQADLLACDALKSNKEALEFCETMAEWRNRRPNAIDLQHPSIPKRIAYLTAWPRV